MTAIRTWAVVLAGVVLLAGCAPSDEASGPATPGRFIPFASEAANLVLSDTNGVSDVFVRDVVARTTERVSVTSDGKQNPGAGFFGSSDPSASADGRYVAFASEDDLVASKTGCSLDCVYLRDRDAGETVWVGEGEDPFVSGDGRVVVFDGGQTGVVLWNRETGETETIAAGGEDPVVSGDGQVVAFQGFVADFLIRGVLVYDRSSGTTERVSVGDGGVVTNKSSGDGLALSRNGRFVAFDSKASNLVSDDRNGMSDVFVYDRKTDKTSLVSATPTGTAGAGDSSLRRGGSATVSDDGRFIAFDSYAADLVAGDTNDAPDVFVRDRVAGTTELVSRARDGEQSSGNSSVLLLEAGGRFIAFESDAADLVAGDTNDGADVFVRDRAAGTTTLVSAPIPPLVVSAPDVQPTRPKPGQGLVAIATVTVAGRPAEDTTTECFATLPGTALPPARMSYADGRLRCSWTLPAAAAGEQVRLELSAASPNGSARRTVLLTAGGTRSGQEPAWRAVAVGDDVPPLSDVSATSPTDVWAVGGWDEDSGTTSPVAVHWNGKTLKRFEPITPSMKGGQLRGVAALSPVDVWGVGDEGSPWRPVIVHWNGRGWARAQLPSSGNGLGSLGNGLLSDVIAFGADDVWAVGRTGVGDFDSRALVLHWDGARWNVVDVRGEAGIGTELSAIDGTSSTDVWADGTAGLNANSMAGYYDFVLHWDGRQWTRDPASARRPTRIAVPSEGTTGLPRDLDAVTALSPTEVWAVGNGIIARYSP